MLIGELSSVLHVKKPKLAPMFLGIDVAQSLSRPQRDSSRRGEPRLSILDPLRRWEVLADSAAALR
jgi:hypothetical protein